MSGDFVNKRNGEHGALTEPIQLLIEKGIQNGGTPEQISAEVLQAITGKLAHYSSGDEISILSAPARMLITLIDEPYMTQRALSIYLGISEAAVQKTIKSLIQQGLVAKTKYAGRNSYQVDTEKFLQLNDIRHLQRALRICQDGPDPF